MNAKRILFVSALCLLIATTALGATVQVSVSNFEGTLTPFDLGVQIGEVISVRLHLGGQAEDYYYHCVNSYPGGDVEYDLYEPLHVFFVIESNDVISQLDWYTPNGSFVEELTFPSEPDPAYLSDGQGTFFYESWVELFPPESEDCGIYEIGFLLFTEDMVLIVEYTPAVPNERSTWGAVKSLFE